MKIFITLFLLPLLVAILTSNSRFQYGNPPNDSSIDSAFVSDSSEHASNKFVLNREVQFVPSNFVYEKQKWYIRFLGVFLIFLPFAYFPFKKYFEDEALGMAINMRHLSNDLMGQAIRQNVISRFKKDFYIAYAIYLAVYNILIICLGLFLKISICLYTLLIYEKVINFFARLF